MKRTIHLFRLLLVIQFFNITAVCSQSISSERPIRKDLFTDYISLFASLDVEDSTLQLHEIEYANYPYYTKIDPIFEPLVDTDPFFVNYATFKIEKTQGILVCVYRRYTTGEGVTIGYVELITYSPEGSIKEVLKLPICDWASYYGRPAGYDLGKLYVSGNKLVYEYISYRNGIEGDLVQKKTFEIREDGGLKAIVN